jgi:ribosome-associated protein
VLNASVPAGTLKADDDRESAAHLTPIDHARRIARLAEEKLARDVVILDMRPVVSYTDCFVICSGQNPRQAKAIADEIHETLKREDRLIPRHVSGAKEATWIILDYLDVVVHVFTPEARAYYRLERLWGDVPSVELAAG